MKKFFKALAVVLALTLVLGTIPASAAAGDVSLKKTAKTLYIGGSQGTKADGTACKVGGAALFSKLVKGFDKSTMTISVESDNNDVAEASTKSSKVTAASIGTANVTITVFEDGAEILKGVVAVNVKKNATSVPVAEGDIFDGAKVGVNTEYTVVLPRKSAGAFVDTDSRMLVASDDSVVITRVEGAPTTFTVVFTKEGEYTLTPYAYQSAKFPGETCKGDAMKVSVSLVPVSVKQSSLNSVAVEFESSVEGLLSTANFKANTEVSGVEIPFSSVKSVTPKDTTAIVEFYTNFTEDKEYTIKYNDKAVGKFTSVKVAKDSVDSIVAEHIKVYNNEITEITGAKLLDANKVDITASSALTSKIEYKLVDAPATEAFISGNNIYIKDAGKTYVVEASYKYGTKDPITVRFQVVSIAKPAYVFQNIDAELSGVYKLGTKDITTMSADELKELKHIVLSKTVVASECSAELQIVANFTKENADPKKVGFANTDTAYGVFTAYSSDESYVMLTEKNGAAYGLKANKEGTATILIEREFNGKKEVVGAVTVEVVGDRKATSFSASAKDSNNKINIAEASTNKTTTLVFSLKDQFNEDMAIDYSKLTVTQTESSKEVATVSVDKFTGLLTVVSDKLTDTKTYGEVTVICKYADLAEYPVTITVGKENTAETQELVLSTDKIDAAVLPNDKFSTDDLKLVTVSLSGLTKNNFKVAGKTIVRAANNEAPVPAKGVTGGATEYVYTVTNLDKGSTNWVDNTIVATIGGKSLGVNTYVVTAYEIEYKKDANGVDVKLVNVIGSKSFTVVNTQKNLELSKQKFEKVNGEADIYSAFEFKFNGVEVGKADGVELVYTVDGDNAKAYVKSASYVVKNVNTGNVTVTKDLGILINLK